MLSTDVKIKALRHTISLLRTWGPSNREDIRCELLTQDVTVTQDAAPALVAWVIAYLTNQRIIQAHGKGGKVRIHSCMFDSNGNFKGCN